MTAQEQLWEEFKAWATNHPQARVPQYTESARALLDYMVDVVIPREREVAVDQHLEDQMEQDCPLPRIEGDDE